MSTPRSLAKLVPAIALLALAIPSAAFGQATRTWVSGTGDDANPCSRTAPCKTFPGAITKTAAGGEINCIDAAGYGAVTITKSIAIKCHNTEAGVLVAGSNAIVINAAPTDKVTLDGLDINGVGTGPPTSWNGIKVISAKNVQIINSEIYRFQAAINVNPTSALTRVTIANNHIHGNNIGVIDAPASNSATNPLVTMRDNLVTDNVCGASVGTFGANSINPTTTDCGTASSSTGVNVVAHLLAYGNGFFDNGTALLARGANSRLEIGGNDISTNDAGLARLDNGFIKSFGNNQLIDNSTTVAPDGPNDTFTKRHVKKRFRRHVKSLAR